MFYSRLSSKKLAHKVAIVLVVSTVVGSYQETKFLYAIEQDKPLTKLTSPIKVASSAAAGDGGTIFIELVGGNEERLSLAVSQNSWKANEGDIPHDTLFVNVANPAVTGDLREGRLPKSEKEVNEVLRLLNLAAKANDQHFNFNAAKDALRRLEQKPVHDIRDPSKGIEPKWYQSYEKKQQQLSAIAQEFDERESRFFGCFPPRAYALLEPSQSGPFSDKEIRRRARGILALFDDRTELCVTICKAFGIRNDDGWGLLDESDLVLVKVLKDVDSEHFLLALPHIDSNRETRLGASRVLFDPSIYLIKSLSSTEWRKYVPNLANIALDIGSDTNHAYVISAISDSELPAATKLLREIADNKRVNEATSPRSNVCPHIFAIVMLALRNDQGIKSTVEKLLDDTTRDVDVAALEVSMALLGEPKFLSKSHFKLRTRQIELAALKAIENYGGKYGIDILIYSAMTRRSVQQEAVIALQRLSGQRWLPSEEVQQRGEYAKDAAAWWKSNPNAFAQPYVGD